MGRASNAGPLSSTNSWLPPDLMPVGRRKPQAMFDAEGKATASGDRPGSQGCRTRLRSAQLSQRVFLRSDSVQVGVSRSGKPTR